MHWLAMVGLTVWLSTAPQSTVTAATVMEQAQHTLGLIYDMQFTEALQAAQGLVEVAPQHPIGYFYRAATYWQWRLILYDTTRRSVFLEHFLEASQRAVQAAEGLLATQETEASFYLGATYGMQARTYFVERDYLKALRTARQAAHYLQRCVNGDSPWYDAYAGLGTYHYVLARVPWVWRLIVQQIVGIKGDRARGLQELERARTHGRLSVPEAASLLAKIYGLPDERQYQQAYALLEPLVQRYPHNFDYRYRLALLCQSLGLWERALQLYQSLITDLTRGAPYYDRQWLPLLQYRVAETHILQGHHAIAAPLLEKLLLEQDAVLLPWVKLRLGNVYDLRRQRQAAQMWYNEVEQEPVARELAARYDRRPFVAGPGTLKPPEYTI